MQGVKPPNSLPTSPSPPRGDAHQPAQGGAGREESLFSARDNWLRVTVDLHQFKNNIRDLLGVLILTTASMPRDASERTLAPHKKSA